MENKGAVTVSMGKLTPLGALEIDSLRPRSDKKRGLTGVLKVAILLIAALAP